MKTSNRTQYHRAWRAKNKAKWQAYKRQYNKKKRDKINARKRLLALRDAYLRAINRTKQ